MRLAYLHYRPGGLRPPSPPKWRLPFEVRFRITSAGGENVKRNDTVMPRERPARPDLSLGKGNDDGVAGAARGDLTAAGAQWILEASFRRTGWLSGGSVLGMVRVE